MFNPNDYNGETNEREADEAFGERMAAFDRGLCSLASVHAGGAVYERDLAETAMELREARQQIAAPVAIALNSWLSSQTFARRTPPPAYAAIGNGLFVRMGNGKKRRRAA